MLFGGITLPGCPDPANVQRLDILPLQQISRMMSTGIAIDREYLWNLSSQLDSRKTILSQEISSYLPQSALEQFVSDSQDDSLTLLNPDSSPQISKLLFETLRVGFKDKLKLKLTKSGSRISSGKKQLEALKRRHPVIPIILEYRECSKLRSMISTIVEAAIYEGDGIYSVHGEIVSTRTDTGRLAMRRPNLQNVPARSSLGRELRAGLIARPGYVLISVDFSQIELRLLAHASRDISMLRIFESGGDIHTDTAMRAFGLSSMDKVDKLLHRAPCKNCNFGICIAYGQKILTNRGLVPIQEVTTCDKVWDGIEFVAHDGVVYNGVRNVITYQGLTATPDHKVWLEDGRAVCLAQAMAERSSLATTGDNGIPIRYDEGHFRDDLQRQRLSLYPSEMYQLRDSQAAVGGQYPFWQNTAVQMPAVQIQAASSLGPAAALFGYPAALYQPQDQKLQELRRAWDREQVCHTGDVHHLHAAGPSSPYLHEGRYRPDRQRGPLRTGEPGAAVQIEESHEPSSQTAKVYDILNAGPRRRFTCEGKLVSNCYGLGPPGLFDLMALTYATANLDLPDFVTLEWCADFIEKWFDLYPACREYFSLQHRRALRYGIVWTEFGRVRRIPEVLSCHERIRQAGLRQAGNMPIQGMAADVFKIAMARVERLLTAWRDAGVYCEALLPVHDELLIECDPKWAEDICQLIGYEMSQALVDIDTERLMCRCPIEADGNIMARWVKK